MANGTITRRSNIDDVARLAGVSRAAVSKVIRDAYGVSPQMRVKVQRAIGVAYRPRVSARAMRGTTHTLGLAIPALGNQRFGEIVAGAVGAVAGTGYQLIIAPAGAGQDELAIETLVDRQVDGIVAVLRAVDPVRLEALAQHTPLVVLGRHDRSEVYDTVDLGVGATEASSSALAERAIRLLLQRVTGRTFEVQVAITPGLTPSLTVAPAGSAHEPQAIGLPKPQSK